MEKNLHKFKFNQYSQNGEDGVIHVILQRVFVKQDKLNIVEFGIADGKYFSNTFKLIENKKVQNAIYIEENKNLFSKLYELSKLYPEIKPINLFVDHKKNSQNSLDKILEKNNFNKEYDILSIDIDSYDLDVYRSIEVYHPKLLIIEAGKQSYGVFSEHSQNNQFNSFSSIYNIVSKKYYLIFYNGNMFFLNKNYFSKSCVLKNFFLDDELHYLLHNLYHDYERASVLKKTLIDIISTYKNFIKFLIKLKFLKNYSNP